MSTDDNDMMQLMQSPGTTGPDVANENSTNDSSTGSDESPGFEDAAASDNPATIDPTTKECSDEGEVTEILTFYFRKTKQSLGMKEMLSGKPYSIVRPTIEGPATNDASSNESLIHMSNDVLLCIPKETEILLAEITTFSMRLQRREIRDLVTQQKCVADDLMPHLLRDMSYRTYVNDYGTMYVVEDDPMNPFLGELETELLMDLCATPRKHCIWKHARQQIRNLWRSDTGPLIAYALDILTGCLKVTRLDQEKLLRLQNESWEGIRLEEWLPQTVCRIFGQDVKDGAPYAETILRVTDPEVFRLTTLLIDMQYMGLDKDEIPKMLKYVHPFNQLIPSLSLMRKSVDPFDPLIPPLWLQQEEIEEEIRYHRVKLRKIEDLKRKFLEIEADTRKSLETEDEFIGRQANRLKRIRTEAEFIKRQADWV